jgi:hypothetical protein
MPRMRCPGCQRVLRVDESKRGDVIGCPKCRERFAVPRFAEDDEPVDEQPAEYALKNEPDAPRPKPPPLEEEDEDDRPRYRRRGKRRRAASDSGLPDFLTEWNLDKMLLVGSIGVGLVLFGAALVAPPLLFGLFGAACVMLTVSRVWAIVAAFGESSESGCLTVVFPWYGLFGLEDKRPVFLFAVGIIYLLLGAGVLTILSAAGYLHG